MQKQITIIGAGPAGLTAGLELARKGYKPRILESSSSPGGLCKTFELWGQLVDIGPHRFFTKNNRVYKLWREMAGDILRVNRCTRIYFNGKYFNYPLEAKNAIINLGVSRGIKCIVSYLQGKTSKNPDTNFEYWICNRFGQELYNTFFKTYSEKLWGIPCTEIHTDFAAQRIKGFTLGEAIKKAIGITTNKHKTAIEEFDYPLKGTGKVYKNMAAEIIKLGGEIHYEQAVINIDIAEKIVTTNRQRYRFDRLLSTMPITQLISALAAPQELINTCNKLSFRNTVLVYIELDKNPFPDNWLYIHSQELKVGRITNFSNWGTAREKTILCMEYWCSCTDQEWNQTDKAWEELASKEATSLGYTPTKFKVKKISKSYPIYNLEYKNLLAPVRAFLTTKGIVAIGRYGSFRYNNQDHSILMGILAAENEIGANHNLWEVNEDQEYQENFKLPSK